jgi:hypothetical protein
MSAFTGQHGGQREQDGQDLISKTGQRRQECCRQVCRAAQLGKGNLERTAGTGQQATVYLFYRPDHGTPATTVTA